MAVSVIGFLVLLAAVGILRLCELLLSKRHQDRLLALGARKLHEPGFQWMVLTHIGVLAGAALEVVLLKRPFIPILAGFMGVLFLLANALRWWVIRTLKMHWTVLVMNSSQFGVVTGGPFRFVRHPNYSAVFVELLALPLIHTAWLTALAGAIAHAWVLTRRLAVEESALLGNRMYLETMAAKPRFIPGLF